MDDEEAPGPANQQGLRLPAVLLFAGVVVTAAAGFPHPEGADANDHQAISGIYAASRSWTAVHLVGLKQAVDDWASATNGDKAVRFASAESFDG